MHRHHTSAQVASAGRLERLGEHPAAVPGPPSRPEHRSAPPPGRPEAPPDLQSDLQLDIVATNRSGRTTGLTTFTPLPRRWSPFVRGVLRLKSWLGPDRTLRRLSFIHVAYWSMVDTFPGETRRRRYSYLLFVSNFNGSWLDYIDVFSRTVPHKMALLWGSSFGFPGAMPPRPFTDYIRDNDWELAHYFSAYPGATATEIASALRVSERFEAELARPEELDDVHLVRAWYALLADTQRDL